MVEYFSMRVKAGPGPTLARPDWPAESGPARPSPRTMYMWPSFGQSLRFLNTSNTLFYPKNSPMLSGLHHFALHTLIQVSFPVARASRNNGPVSEIIPLDFIISSCHLIPRFRTKYHQAKWDSNTVLKECKSFFLNKYINIRFFFELEQRLHN